MYSSSQLKYHIYVLKWEYSYLLYLPSPPNVPPNLNLCYMPAMVKGLNATRGLGYMVCTFLLLFSGSFCSASPHQ